MALQRRRRNKSFCVARTFMMNTPSTSACTPIPTPCSMVRTPRSPSFSSVDSRWLLCHSNDHHHDLDGVDAFPCLRWHRRLVRVLHRPGVHPISILVQAQDIASPSTKKEPTAPFFMRFPIHQPKRARNSGKPPT